MEPDIKDGPDNSSGGNSDIPRICKLCKQERKERIRKGFYLILAACLWFILGIVMAPTLYKTLDKQSPSDFIKPNNLLVDDQKACIYYSQMGPGRISDTKSMDPLMDSDSLVLAIPFTGPDQIKEGDIVVYRNDETGHGVIHRVREKKDTGVVTQGDNNMFPDPEVPYSDIEKVVVGVLY